MTTTQTTAQILADLTIAVSSYEGHWRENGSHSMLGVDQAAVDKATAALRNAIGDATAEEVRRALVMAAAANRNDSVALRDLDKRTYARGGRRFATDYDAAHFRAFIADPEC